MGCLTAPTWSSISYKLMPSSAVSSKGSSIATTVSMLAIKATCVCHGIDGIVPEALC